MESVKIVSLPDKGTLTLDGEAIAMTDVPKTVTRAELQEGKLVYSPPETETGDDLTTFTFRVNDGTSDSEVYTMTVSVGSRSTVPGDIEVNFGAPSYTATEGGTAATVEVTLSRAPSAEVQIPLSVLSRNWGAVAGDHSTIPSTVTFATTDTSQTFTVTATDDELNDDGESVTLGFGTLPTGYAAGPTETTTVSLADNDGVLVSNTGKTPAARSSANLEDNDYEAYFTTGPHPAGYVVDSIEPHADEHRQFRCLAQQFEFGNLSPPKRPRGGLPSPRHSIGVAGRQHHGDGQVNRAGGNNAATFVPTPSRNFV